MRERGHQEKHARHVGLLFAIRLKLREIITHVEENEEVAHIRALQPYQVDRTQRLSLVHRHFYSSPCERSSH